MKRTIKLIALVMTCVIIATSFAACAKKRILVIDDIGDTSWAEQNDISDNTTELENINDKDFIVKNEDLQKIENILESLYWEENHFEFVNDKYTDGLIFKLNDELTTYTVTGYIGTSESVIIPSTYAGLPVKVIGPEAFLENAIITEVVICYGVDTIEYDAFRNCSDLEKIVLPNSLKMIGGSAFGSCRNLETVIMSNNIEIIGSSAFSNCTKLENIRIPDDIKSILPDAFINTPFYDSLVWDENALYIGSCMIGISENFNERVFVIKDGIKSISSRVFFNIESLETIILPESLNYIGNGSFAACPIKNLIIPNSVEYIGLEAFNACGMDEVLIGKGVKFIGSAAFGGNELTTVYYHGIESEWALIDIIEEGNSQLLSADRYYYSETEPTVAGTFWHYVDGVPTPW